MTEALSLFKKLAVATGGAQGAKGVITALLCLHRDQEAAEFLQDLRKQGKSEPDLLVIGYPGPDRETAQSDDFFERLHRLAPDAPLRVGGKVKRPEILHQARPATPTEAWHHPGFNGTVILEAIIDTAGKVTNVRILKGQPMGLNESAMDAVKEWTFKPATLDGQPISVFYVLTVNYKIGPLHPSPWPSP